MTVPPPKADRFLELFPVPDAPVDAAVPTDWEAVEAELSIRLPDDYKWFIEHYGTGCVDSFLWIFNPLSTNEHLNLLRQVDSLSAQYREQQTTLGERVVPFPIYPEVGGLVPFGSTDNGDVLFWRGDSPDPGAWAVVENPVRSDVYEVYERTMVAFLVGVATGEVTSAVLTIEGPEDELFLPVDEAEY